MRIELREEVPCQIKMACTACGVWDRPGEPAFFVDGNTNEWICRQCVEAGEGHIRQMFLKQAEQHRLAAAAYEEGANGEILISELQIQRAKAIARREREAWEAEKARAYADGEASPDDDPFAF